MTFDLQKWFEQWSVFSKGAEIPGADRNRFRRDEYGNIIDYYAYGDTNHEHGWEIGHRLPLSRNGSDSLDNKFPQSVRMNRYLGARTPEQGRIDALLKFLADLE